MGVQGWASLVLLHNRQSVLLHQVQELQRRAGGAFLPDFPFLYSRNARVQ